ncbi:hypothetical protein AV530_011278 [Patagioenas fasciata monilis]|uniref:Uncharacterized protein n=1 Tax=Patagioenas fasciata monilis TaxID=372326 RepID=A0A1V4KNR3_PATFA|nr:hypothetical protein AV530_011278 [Patagioenas fasciata monilis]
MRPELDQSIPTKAEINMPVLQTDPNGTPVLARPGSPCESSCREWALPITPPPLALKKPPGAQRRSLPPGAGRDNRLVTRQGENMGNLQEKGSNEATSRYEEL